jgi:hypothetical protein
VGAQTTIVEEKYEKDNKSVSGARKTQQDLDNFLV